MYRFKLEALLTHRRHQEEVGQKELAQAQRKLSAEREILEEKKRKKLEELENLQAKKKDCTTVSDILLHMNYIQQLSREIEDQAKRAHQTSQLVDEKRHELVSIMQKHKTLKKLKYKEEQVYQKKLIQNERKMMDEVAATRHGRRI